MFYFAQKKHTKTCFVCYEDFEASSRTRAYCKACKKKVTFLTRRIPRALGGRMKAAQAVEFIQDHPEWEVPNVKKNKYNQYL